MKSINEQIRQAIEEGKFKDLPGEGKPLNLDENPHEDPEWRTAYRMLRSSGYTLPWIESRITFEESLARARDDLSRAWDWRRDALEDGQASADVEAEWQRACSAFGDKIAQVNKNIADYNLEVPTSSLQLPRLKIEHEISRISIRAARNP